MFPMLPFFFDDGLRYPQRRLHQQHFGLGLSPDDLLVVCPSLSREYYRPWRHMAAAAKDLGSSIKSDKDKYQINLDVQHFAPEEINVKAADGYIIVEGKHEEKQDEHGFISRQFVRKYAMPEGTTSETVTSKLSSDGVLSITMPKKVSEALKGERIVPIAQTGPVRKEIKEKKEGAEKMEQ